MSTFVNIGRGDLPDFYLVGDQVYVKGRGLFDIKDRELHALYPNFTTTKKMIKEIEAELERTELVKALNDFSLSHLHKMTSSLKIEARDREACIEQLSELSLRQLQKAFKALR